MRYLALILMFQQDNQKYPYEPSQTYPQRNLINPYKPPSITSLTTKEEIAIALCKWSYGTNGCCLLRRGM